MAAVWVTVWECPIAGMSDISETEANMTAATTRFKTGDATSPLARASNSDGASDGPRRRQRNGIGIGIGNGNGNGNGRARARVQDGEIENRRGQGDRTVRTTKNETTKRVSATWSGQAAFGFDTEISLLLPLPCTWLSDTAVANPLAVGGRVAEPNPHLAHNEGTFN